MTTIKVRVAPYIALLTERKTTNRAVAAELGCRPETLSRVLKALNVKKSPAKWSAATKVERHARVEESRSAILATANDTSLSLAKAAEVCGCSTRTIQRYRRKACS